jgi:hypothetical protein
MNWFEIFRFEIINNKYKIYYYGSGPISVLISTKLIGLDCVNETVKFTFNKKGNWFIPNLDYRGCSTISFKNSMDNTYMFDKIIDKSISKVSKGQNVICIGLNKTGTSSFILALENLGYKKFSESQQFQFIGPEVYHGDLGKIYSVLNNPQYNLFNDIPFSFPNIYKKIYEQRPNDVFILTIRESPEKWVKSVLNFYKGLKTKKSFIETTFKNLDKRFLFDYLNPMYKSWGIESETELETKLLETYKKHYEDCLNFFEFKPNFFVVEIEKKGELKKLSDWLNLESSEEDFPWINKGSI